MVESEVKLCSDKAKAKKHDRDRSRVIFGQGEVKKAWLSPKSSHVRTRQRQKSMIVTEVEPCSDKAKAKKHDRDRSRVMFGQGEAKKHDHQKLLARGVLIRT